MMGRIAREDDAPAVVDTALEALRSDLSPRAQELAEKSTLGTLTVAEKSE